MVGILVFALLALAMVLLIYISDEQGRGDKRYLKGYDDGHRDGAKGLPLLT